MTKIKTVFKQIPVVTWFVLLMIIVFSFFSDQYLTMRNLRILLQQGSVLLVVASAATFIIISGGMDLSLGGILTLSGVSLNGANSQYAFASLKDNMYTHFGLTVLDSEISNFDYALKVYKESFAERITFKNTTITNCANGLELSEETNDKGDYNAEYITIDNCQFNNVRSNVIDYYRGGHDESTIGGNLLVTNSTFSNCGTGEKNGILLNTYGIINVDISNNTFQNNRVKHVALLWGAKNNTHSDNHITNSGTIKVQENLEMKMMY